MRALKTQIGTGLSNPGGPTTADTNRLVVASEAQLVELLRQGYVFDSADDVRTTETIRDVSYSRKGQFKNYTDRAGRDEMIDAIVKTPEMLVTAGTYPNWIYENIEYTPDELNRMADSIEEFVVELEKNALFSSTDLYPGRYEQNAPRYIEDIKEHLEDLRELKEGGQYRGIKRPMTSRKVGEYAGTILHSIGRDLDRLTDSPFSAEDIQQVEDAMGPIPEDRKKMALGQSSNSAYQRAAAMHRHKEEIQNTPIRMSRNRHLWETMSMVKYANPDLDWDPEFYLELDAAGYEAPGMIRTVETADAFKNAGISLNNARKQFLNWYNDDSETVTVNRGGDRPPTQEVVKERTTEKLKMEQLGGSFSSVRSLYPDKRVQEYINNLEGYREDTDQREDLGDGFYLDREKEGTGAVRRDDLPKTLFSEDILPGKKMTLWNEDEQDLVSVYVYDKPEMLDAAGVERYDSVSRMIERRTDPAEIIEDYERRMDVGSEVDEETQERTQEILKNIRSRNNPPPVPQKPPGLTPIKKKQAGPIAMTGRGGLMKPKTSMPRGQKEMYGMRITNPTKFQGGQLEQTKFVGGKEKQMTIEEAAHHVYKRGKRRFNSNPEIGLREATREAINLGKKGLMNVDLSDANDYPDNYLSISL